MCLALGLLPSDQSTIAAAHPGNPHDCLQAVVVKWLQKSYDYQRHGCPTWRMLVEAVGDPAGGNDCALAEAIAKKHPGMKYKTFIPNKDGFSSKHPEWSVSLVNFSRHHGKQNVNLKHQVVNCFFFCIALFSTL